MTAAYSRVFVTLVVQGDDTEAKRVCDAVSDLALIDDAVESFDATIEAVQE